MSSFCRSASGLKLCFDPRWPQQRQLCEDRDMVLVLLQGRSVVLFLLFYCHCGLLGLWRKKLSDWRHPFVLFFIVERWETGEQAFMCPKEFGMECSCTLKLWGRRLGSVFESPGECVWENLCGPLESPQREGIKHKCTDFTTGVGTRALWSEMPWKKCSLFAAWQTFVLQVLWFTYKVLPPANRRPKMPT